MADGDEIHATLPYRFQSGYKQVHEWVLPREDIGQTIARGLRGELKDRFTDEALALLIRIADYAGACQDNSSIQWAIERHRVRELIQRTELSADIRWIIEDSCRRVVLQLEAGEHPESLGSTWSLTQSTASTWPASCGRALLCATESTFRRR